MIYLRFLWSLLRHKWFVLLAGRLTGVPLWRLVIHDWSKFSPSEFGQYARNFQGDYSKSPNDRDKVDGDFLLAWLHHENRNPHHWGYWIPRTGKSANNPLPMPETYVREMIADCLGASRAYTGAWDIAVWLNEHGRDWKIHDETLEHIWTVMIKLGYFITDNCEWSWMAGEKFSKWATT